MSHRFARGLVVGKFSPLHRGHQRLIDHALARCDELIAISWSKPEFRCCEVANRERWLAELDPAVKRVVIDDAALERLCQQRGIAARPLPRNDADDDTHRAFVAWLCTDLLATTVDVVFTSEDYGDGFAASLERHFTRQLGRVHAVRHVCVDRHRIAVPISATAIRADVDAHRAWLPPVVQEDLVRRVAILGGESSGKTTLARALAERLATPWAAEYGRELWEACAGRLEFDDMLHIAQEQIRRERRLARCADRWLFCDTTPLTTAFYSEALFGRVDPALAALAQRKYDLVVLCAPDFGFVQDGTRRDEIFRARQHGWYLEQLGRMGQAFVIASGTLAERIEFVASRIDD